MMNNNIIDGKLCQLNCLELPIDKHQAKDLVEYFDAIYPKVKILLEVTNCPSRVYIFTTSEDCFAAKYDNDKIKFNPDKVGARNLGFLTHEVTHIVQNYTLSVYQQNCWLTEAMADYVRIKLGWDNNTVQCEYPCKNVHLAWNCSKCGADFLQWLEQQKGHFVVELNRALQNGQNGEQFITNKFSKDTQALYGEYLECGNSGDNTLTPANR